MGLGLVTTAVGVAAYQGSHASVTRKHSNELHERARYVLPPPDEGATQGELGEVRRHRLVPVLLGLRTLEQKRVGGPLGERSMLDPSRHDEQVPSVEVDRSGTFELDPERTVPAQEQLVLFVMMPRELALQAHNPHDGIVHGDEVLPLPRSRQRRCDGSDRYRLARLHVTLPRGHPIVGCGRRLYSSRRLGVVNEAPVEEGLPRSE